MGEVPAAARRTSPAGSSPDAFSNYHGAWTATAVRGAALQLIFHEYTHFYLASQFAGEYPPWFNEGMAELMGFAKFDHGMAIMQVPDVARVRGARRRLDSLRAADPRRPQLARVPVAQARELVLRAGLAHRALRHGREPRVRQADVRVPEPAQQPASLRRGARTAFGPDLAVIDKQLRDYSRNTSMASGAHCDRRDTRGDAARRQAGGGARCARDHHRQHARRRSLRPIASGRWWNRWRAASPSPRGRHLRGATGAGARTTTRRSSAPSPRRKRCSRRTTSRAAARARQRVARDRARLRTAEQAAAPRTRSAT